MKNKLTSNMEDYLEAILDVMNKEKAVRVTDVSKALNVKKPSVNSAVRKLKSLKLVNQERYDTIFLTEKGKKEAEKIKHKHDVLLNFLSEYLGVPKETAVEEACKIEHTISNDTLERISDFVEFLDKSEFFVKNEWRSKSNHEIV